MKTGKYNNSVLTYMAAFVVFCLFAYLAYRSLVFPYLSYDESGQFFMSKGLNHHSEPFANFGSLADALENNKHYNLDPGGFTVLLYFWSLISNECFWLRVLPMLFFAGFLFFAYRIIYDSTKNGMFAALGCGLLLLSEDITYQLQFLRAYSMEMCGTTSSLYLLLKWRHKLTSGRLLGLSVLLAFYCTSRYSFLFTAFVVGLIVAILIYKENNTWKLRMNRLLLFAFPVLLVCAVIFFGMTIHQNAGASNLGYTTYLSTSPSALKGKLAIAFYLLLAFCLYFYFKYKQVQLPLVVALAVAAISFILSLLDKFPWDGKKDISMTVLLYIGIYIALLQLVKPILIKYRGRKYVPVMFLLIIVTTLGVVKRNREKEFRMHDNYIAFMNTHPVGKVFVNWTLSPDLRYLYEFGAFRDRVKRDDYPHRLVLGNREWHSYSNEKGMIKVLNLEKSDCQYYYTNSSAPINGWYLLEKYGSIFKRKGM